MKSMNFGHLAFALFLVAVLGCSHDSKGDGETRMADSLFSTLDSKLDSFANQLQSEGLLLDSLEYQLEALRDSSRAVLDAAHWHSYLGELPAKCKVLTYPVVNGRNGKRQHSGAAVRPRRQKHAGMVPPPKTPGKGVSDRPVTNQKLLDSLDRVAAQRNKYWDSLWVEKQKKLKEAGK